MEEITKSMNLKKMRYCKEIAKIIRKIMFYIPKDINTEITWYDDSKFRHTERLFLPAFNGTIVYNDFEKYVEKASFYAGIVIMQLENRNQEVDIISVTFNDLGDPVDIDSIAAAPDGANIAYFDDLAFSTARRVLQKQGIRLYRKNSNYMAIDSNVNVVFGENFTLSLGDVYDMI